MNDMSQKSIQVRWISNQLVGLNSISYGNNTVTLLNIYSSYSDDKKAKTYYAFPIADTTIDSIERYNDDVWTEIQLCNSQVTVEDLTISCGEGSMGNEGCIVATTDSNKLVWAIFSIESNPFIKLEVVNDFLLAYSDYLAYTINLNNLTEISINQY